MQQTLQADKKYKIIWVGDSGVGKTCLLTKALKNFFDQEIKSTLGFEYFNITINLKDKKILLQTWDTCGQESFECIVNIFYKRAKLAILVYSIDDRKSFDRINFWLSEIRLNANENTKLILIGNKNDLEKRREVSYEEGKSFSKVNGFDLFMESSAKEGDTPNLILNKAAKILYDSEIESLKKNQDINDNSGKKSFKLEEFNDNKSNKDYEMTSCKDCI